MNRLTVPRAAALSLLFASISLQACSEAEEGPDLGYGPIGQLDSGGFELHESFRLVGPLLAAFAERPPSIGPCRADADP